MTIRRDAKIARRAAFITASMLASVAGCVIDFAGGCEGTKTCENAATASGVGGAGDAGQGAGGVEAGGGGGGGGETITPLSCVPSVNIGPIANECGIFVSSSEGNDDGNAGTKESPLKTLGAAIQRARDEKKRVYACAQVFTESILIDTGVELYGGLDCTKDGWPFTNMKSTILKGVPDAPALQLKNPVGGVYIENFQIQAADASTLGWSSIAVLANGADAVFVRCDLVAGTGAKGKDGSDGEDSPAMSGKQGNSGWYVCYNLGNNVTSPGGEELKNNCSMFDMSVGGKGGDGGLVDDKAYPAGNGAAGTSLPNNGLADAAGGKGEDTNGLCEDGAMGAPGIPGDNGAGATGLGTLTAEGYVGMSGDAGTVGAPGQGGGGGGGARGTLTKCPFNLSPGSGASGGSGGAGGCGGQPGTGGDAGGASIALVSYQANVTLTDCKLTSGLGGNGGAGGRGQEGGWGGDGGEGGKNGTIDDMTEACAGGKGGKGGNGGSGGGGRGGHTIRIAYVGNPPKLTGTKFTAGTPGAGGPGGHEMNTDLNKGLGGIAADQKNFQEQ